MLSDLLRGCVRGIDLGLQHPEFERIYDQELQLQVRKVRQDIMGLVVLLTNTEAAAQVDLRSAVSVGTIAAETASWLSDYGENPETVGGVGLTVDEMTGNWAVEVGADFPLPLPRGCGPVEYDTTRHANAGDAFAAILSSTPVPYTNGGRGIWVD